MMLDEVTCSGEWWLPSNPEKRIKGKLTFNQTNGARLDLEEAFTESPKTICGISLPVGREITLQDCIPLAWGLPEFPYKVFAHRVFLGAHFNNPEGVKFNSLHCQMSNLFEWLWKSGIKYEGEASKNIVIKYDRPEPISIRINPELRIDIDFRHSFSSKRRNGEIQLKQTVYVSFHPKENKNIDDYLNWMHHFRNFLCLATQVSIFPQKIIGLIDDKSPSSMVDVLYQLDAPINTEADVYNSLFTFKDIENKFETCLQNWHGKYDELEPVYQLYFGTLYGRFVYLNLRFLCLVQALEAYHRRAISNEELPKERHKERLTSILNAAPLEHKKWLKEKLAYRNEPSLRSRIKYLCDMFSTTVKTLIPDTRYFINKVVDTRNYMTHYDLNLKDKRAEGKELFIITEKLRIMIEMCLMKEIGFNLDEISNLICKRYQDRLKQYE